MKRILIVITLIILILTACTKYNVTDVSASVENLKTITTTVGTDRDKTNNYQGYISIKTKTAALKSSLSERET